MTSRGDAVILTGIEFLATHGATAEERVRAQRFSVDVTLELDLKVPAGSDRLEDTVNYQEVGEMIVETATRSRHHLLERLAHEMLDGLQDRWPAARIMLKVRKLQPPVPFAVKSIEVQLVRERR